MAGQFNFYLATPTPPMVILERWASITNSTLDRTEKLAYSDTIRVAWLRDEPFSKWPAAYGLSVDVEMSIKIFTRLGSSSFRSIFNGIFTLLAEEPGDALLCYDSGEQAVLRRSNGKLLIDAKWLIDVPELQESIPAGLSYRRATVRPEFDDETESATTAAAGD